MGKIFRCLETSNLHLPLFHSFASHAQFLPSPRDLFPITFTTNIRFAMANPYFNPANDYEAQHEGSKALAINNTFIRRFLTRLALHTTAKFFHRNGPCVPISKHKILKTGYSVHLTEAVTMKYIAQYTSIPVPKVYCSFIHRKRAYIIMERIRSENLADAWQNPDRRPHYRERRRRHQSHDY